MTGAVKPSVKPIPEGAHTVTPYLVVEGIPKLLDFLKRLDRKVTIEVSRHHKGEPYQQVTFAP